MYNLSSFLTSKLMSFDCMCTLHRKESFHFDFATLTEISDICITVHPLSDALSLVFSRGLVHLALATFGLVSVKEKKYIKGREKGRI